MTDPASPPAPWRARFHGGDGADLVVAFSVDETIPDVLFNAAATVRGRPHFCETRGEDATAAVLGCVQDILAGHADLRFVELAPPGTMTRDEFAVAAVDGFARDMVQRVLGMELPDGDAPAAFVEAELAILAERDAAANANRATVYAALHCLGVADCDDPYLALADAVLEVRQSDDRRGEDFARVVAERDEAQRAAGAARVEAAGLKAALAGAPPDVADLVCALAAENESLRAAVAAAEQGEGMAGHRVTLAREALAEIRRLCGTTVVDPAAFPMAAFGRLAVAEVAALARDRQRLVGALAVERDTVDGQRALNTSMHGAVAAARDACIRTAREVCAQLSASTPKLLHGEVPPRALAAVDAIMAEGARIVLLALERGA